MTNNNLPAVSAARQFGNNLFGVIAGSNLFVDPGIDFIPTNGNSGIQYLTGQDQPVWLGLKSKQMQRWAYDYCYALASVIDRLSEYDSNGALKIIRAKGKGRDDLATSPYAQKLNQLFAHPNPFQSYIDFRQQQVAYKKVYGFCPVLPIIPVGFGKEDAVALFNIPPWAITPDVRGNLITNDISEAIRSWRINLFGQTIVVGPDELLILKDTYMMDEVMKYVLPKSRLVGLDMSISNLCYGMESENVMLRKRGAIGFISYDAAASKDSVAGAMPMTEMNKKQLQKEFNRYGLSWNQWQYVISRFPMKWNSTVMDVKKLGIGDAIQRAEKAICHRFGFPYTLYEQQDATYSNGENAEVQLYQNTTIPDNKKDFQAYERFFDAYENNCCILTDFGDIACLQEDEQHKWTAINQRNQALQIEWIRGMITMNEWRQSNGRDTIEGGNIYYPEWLKLNGPQNVQSTEEKPATGE